jgi:hypothetical protein
MAGESVETLERVLKDADGGRIDQYATADFVVPSDVDHAAIAERRFLERVRDDGSVVVADPSGLLATWDSAGLPDWYEVAARESTGPGDRWTDIGTIQALRRATGQWLAVTAEREQVRREVGRLEGELAVEREAHALTRRRLRRIRSELAAMRFGEVGPLPSHIRAAYRIEANEWNGARTLQLMVEHWQAPE